MINKIKRDSFKHIRNCKACRLAAVRRLPGHAVIGRGMIPADILFIGEAPGTVEELLEQAFVGLSGKLLDRMVEDAIHLIQKEQQRIVSVPRYYITNTVLCRPCDSCAGPNRQPLPDEIISCRRNVQFIIDKVQPKSVVFLGKVAESTFRKEYADGVMIYHPAFFLRGGGTGHPVYALHVRKLAEVIERNLK